MRLGVCLIAAALLAGCAARRPHATEQSVAAFERYIAQVREISAAARPGRSNPPTVESSDPELIGARALLEVSPTAANHRRVGHAYARLGVYDIAYDHFTSAIRLNPRDADSFDALARIWRVWGFPGRGLAEAYRARALAPDSPTTYNTVGTLLLDLGFAVDARRAFERALALDPHAGYLFNNLCYAALVQGDPRRAVEQCRIALQTEPGLTAARNNLALAYGALGDWEAASREFARATGPAAARYNMGLALLATRHFDDAALAFDDAAALNPALDLARQRAAQARKLAAAAAATPGS